MSLASRISALATRIGQEIKLKQALLISGTNIKTVNGSSLLGSGDLAVSGGQNVSITGLMSLLYSSETDSSEVISSTSESAALKTYTIPANSYGKIKIEMVVRVRVEQSANTKSDFTWKIKSAGSTVATFVQRIIASSTLGVVSGDRMTDTLSTIIAGGQSIDTALTVTVQNSLNNASTGALVHSFRVYGIKDTVINRGTDGKGIQSTSYNSSTGVLTMTFSDNSTYQTGDMRGAKGDAGDPTSDNFVTYAKIAPSVKTLTTLANGSVDLAAYGGGKITLSANTAFSFSNFQLNKSYYLEITANGYLASWANSAKHDGVDGNGTFSTSGVYAVTLLCTNATSGSEKLLTVIMKKI